MKRLSESNFHGARLGGISIWILPQKNCDSHLFLARNYYNGHFLKFEVYLIYTGEPGSSVGIGTKLRAGLPAFNSRQEQLWEFFSSPPHPDRPWVPPFLLSNGYQGSYANAKTTGSWSWPLPSSAEVKNMWNYTSTPSYIFLAWYLPKQDMALFTLTVFCLFMVETSVCLE
jgi:hypothetical protein